jgi:hypothetical protein
VLAAGNKADLADVRESLDGLLQEDFEAAETRE